MIHERRDEFLDAACRSALDGRNTATSDEHVSITVHGGVVTVELKGEDARNDFAGWSAACKTRAAGGNLLCARPVFGPKEISFQPKP